MEESSRFDREPETLGAIAGDRADAFELIRRQVRKRRQRPAHHAAHAIIASKPQDARVVSIERSDFRSREASRGRSAGRRAVEPDEAARRADPHASVRSGFNTVHEAEVGDRPDGVRRQTTQPMLSGNPEIALAVFEHVPDSIAHQPRVDGRGFDRRPRVVGVRSETPEPLSSSADPDIGTSIAEDPSADTLVIVMRAALGAHRAESVDRVRYPELPLGVHFDITHAGVRRTDVDEAAVIRSFE